MAYEFKLPDLGEGITEGEIVKWLVTEGTTVAEHETIAEIETDKAIVEVPSPRAGVIKKINFLAGDIVDVGEVLFTIDTGVVEEEKSATVVGELPTELETLATPKVRRLAKKLGIDLANITPSGPAGAITEADIRGHEEAGTDKTTADKFGPTERLRIRGVRKSITKNLLRSMKHNAFVTGMDSCDVTTLWDLKEKEEEKATELGAHLTFMPFFMKAVVHALMAFPMLNSSIDEEREEIVIKHYYNIGVATETPDGLMVSVVKDTNKKTIVELARELEELAKKARTRKITLEELSGSTFTISNFGSYGGEYATPIINYPEAGILGTGKVAERPWVVDGEIKIRKILPLSLTFDHRVVDGSTGAKFLSKIIGYLEDPASIFIESS